MPWRPLTFPVHLLGYEIRSRKTNKLSQNTDQSSLLLLFFVITMTSPFPNDRSPACMICSVMRRTEKRFKTYFNSREIIQSDGACDAFIGRQRSSKLLAGFDQGDCCRLRCFTERRGSGRIGTEITRILASQRRGFVLIQRKSTRMCRVRRIRVEIRPRKLRVCFRAAKARRRSRGREWVIAVLRRALGHWLWTGGEVGFKCGVEFAALAPVPGNIAGMRFRTVSEVGAGRGLFSPRCRRELGGICLFLLSQKRGRSARAGAGQPAECVWATAW